jgi:secondary thiamine-phosphate synthase enzyme
MRIAQDRLTIATAPREIREITREIGGWVARQGIARGLLTVFIPHTSASLLIQENYSPDVRRDLAAFLSRLAPEDPDRYRHNDEGPDDEIQLGTCQGIFLLEHRAAPHQRELVLTLIGEE